MKYLVYSYGCQMNTADSEEMAQPLAGRGFTATGTLRDADIVLMNTCTVREQAEHRADSNIGRLRVWKEKDPNRILIVAGCAASRWGDSIKKKYPFIDLVSPATQIEQFPDAVEKVLKERWNWNDETNMAFEGGGETGEGSHTIKTAPLASLPSPLNLFGSEATAYVTIMRGCNYTCSYCIVPQVRGREKYRPMPEILDEIKQRVSQGYKEVMLLGQTVNSYYWRSPVVVDFSHLLGAVNGVQGLERIRFMSPHPRHMREEVIEAMASSPKVCRHIHLPVQSGSSRMLERMKRLYTREDYVKIVDKLRVAMPSILITTDVIVGYPGESEADFEDTLALMEDVRFNGLFAFKYSPRPGTTAAEGADDIPPEVKEERLQRVLSANVRMNNPARAMAS